MTQTLQYEAAWEKQISPQDDQLIEECFQQVKGKGSNDFSLHYIRHDYNHRKALLILVLIHNATEKLVTFTNKQMDCFDENGQQIAAHTFSLPFDIPAKTSMPWTFIFPRGTYEDIGIQGSLTLKI